MAKLHVPQLLEFDLPRGGRARCVDLHALLAARARPLPYCLRVVLENVARQVLAGHADAADIARIADWSARGAPVSAALEVTRLILPDSSGLPVLMDLAAARDAAHAAGAPVDAVEPRVPITLVVDHSLIVDRAGEQSAAQHNLLAEYARNAERYSFFKWAQQAFANLRVVPPGAGIIHQVHLERLAEIVHMAEVPACGPVVAPEFVLGCDSHTPMVNGLGLLAWGVGGIDGEAAALGQRHVVRIPRVVGVRLTGRLPAGATTTDAVLTITERLREVGVVGDFVEFYGAGAARLTVPDRATIANMAPEYGATIGYFPIDAQTIAYLAQSGRAPDHVALVESYAKAAGLYAQADTAEAEYSETVEIDLDRVLPSIAGPKRPQDRVPLARAKEAFQTVLRAPKAAGGFGLTDEQITQDAASDGLRHGSIVLAAITSCTNTSNPHVMIAAGLLARNAVARGLRVPPRVKTSLAPGSRLVDGYLERAGLMAPLEALGFHVVGHGCTTCSGKSGPLNPGVAEEIDAGDLVAAAVLSGNRNFEGRTHPQCRAAYLASPPLVVAYALAGRIDIALEEEPLGVGMDGTPVYLRDIWPDEDEVATLVAGSLTPARFQESYATLFDGAELWQRLAAPSGRRFAWDPESTYVCKPPFFDTDNPAMPDVLSGARALLWVGDTLTTDHITPSGAIAPDGMAGQYLIAQGVAPKDFNAVTQRRGNHEFMARITFGNPRLHNRLAPDAPGGMTRLSSEAPPVSIYAAAQTLMAEGAPAVVLAGRDYGMGSSRDWAAKGPKLLGVRAVLAQGFERIHRANLIGMGIVPLLFDAGQGAEALGLTGFETLNITGLRAGVSEGAPVRVNAEGVAIFEARVDIASDAERSLLLSGGMFAGLLRKLEDAA
ncbi:aconitate hydratase AcnA [Roseovarius pelagicus]|uniref:Aconitate hydratase n=1 Tax=Roseovarius pelagicus TaxID=2980108 RepID=A0ABY6DAC3_9RHOB|nr:aconitate hydratase AcnA [Roseovarius pelagicus]UXX83076.1 aconitate hydratase AcnA [Roseovarius pelagicus]